MKRISGPIAALVLLTIAGCAQRPVECIASGNPYDLCGWTGMSENPAIAIDMQEWREDQRAEPWTRRGGWNPFKPDLRK